MSETNEQFVSINEEEILDKLHEFILTLPSTRQYNLKFSNFNDNIIDEFLNYLQPDYQTYLALIEHEVHNARYSSNGNNLLARMIRYVLSVRIMINRRDRVKSRYVRGVGLDRYSDYSETESDSEDEKVKCPVPIKSGKNKGKSCGKWAKDNGVCNVHKNSTEYYKDKIVDELEEKVKDLLQEEEKE